MLNLLFQCKKYNLPLLRCPQFLFCLMGLFIDIVIIILYFIGKNYIESPHVISLIIILVTGILFLISFVVIQGFERMAEFNILKEEFINIISHKLRSPIASLKWTTEVLMENRRTKKDGIEKEEGEYLQILKENCETMSDLVTDLLIASRLDSGRVVLEKRKVSLEKIVNDIVGKLKSVAESSNIIMEFNVREKLPEIFIDSELIGLVVKNIVENAICYRNSSSDFKKEQSRIIIKLEKKDRRVYFEVKDNGVGISDYEKKYIFEKLFRMGDKTRDGNKRSGLGLYISKSLIEKSGGRIGFKSQEGVGSTFWFTLPIK